MMSGRSLFTAATMREIADRAAPDGLTAFEVHYWHRGRQLAFTIRAASREDAADQVRSIKGHAFLAARAICEPVEAPAAIAGDEGGGP